MLKQFLRLEFKMWFLWSLLSGLKVMFMGVSMLSNKMLLNSMSLIAITIFQLNLFQDATTFKELMFYELQDLQ